MIKRIFYLRNKTVCKKCFKAAGETWTKHDDIAWKNATIHCPGERSHLVEGIPHKCKYKLEHITSSKIPKKHKDICKLCWHFDPDFSKGWSCTKLNTLQTEKQFIEIDSCPFIKLHQGNKEIEMLKVKDNYSGDCIDFNFWEALRNNHVKVFDLLDDEKDIERVKEAIRVLEELEYCCEERNLIDDLG